MSQVTDQIMHVIIRKPGCALEELTLECPGLTWNQVFSELDRMSRTEKSDSQRRDGACMP